MNKGKRERNQARCYTCKKSNTFQFDGEIFLNYTALLKQFRLIKNIFLQLSVHYLHVNTLIVLSSATLRITSDLVISVSLQEQAFELSQKYKEGKYIIELSHMIKDNGWD